MYVDALIPQIGIGELASVVDSVTVPPGSALQGALPQATASAIRECLECSADTLAARNFCKVFLMQPELVFMEALSQNGFKGQLYVCLANDLDERDAERVSRNVPAGLDVSSVREGTYPRDFSPRTDALVAFGIARAPGAWLPETEARLADYYADFTGEKILVDLSCGTTAERPLRWNSLDLSRCFTQIFF